MDNPFSFIDVVEGDSFCNRQKEQIELKNFIENSQNVLIYSHRRYGKTSLINIVFNHLKEITPIYIDLFGTTSIEEFITELFKSLSSIESRMEKLMKLIKEKISNITINFSIDIYTGAPVAIPAFTRGCSMPDIDEVFSLLEYLSKKKKIVIAFDEFQEIAKYGDDSFEKKLRKSIQWHKNISYIFAGSQKNLLGQMFSDSKRAFYKQAISYPLMKIDSESYINWIQELYTKDKRKINSKYTYNVVERCEHHPMYIQEFFYYLWDLNEITMNEIENLERRILKNREIEFINQWDSLSLNQKRTLKLIVLTSGGKNIYSSDNLSTFNLTSASQVKRALEFLEKREFIIKNGTYKIQDIFFKIWIQKLM